MIKKIKAYFERKAKVKKYVGKLQGGVITIDDVPAEYFDEVYRKVQQ